MTAMTTQDIESTLRKLRLSGMAETLQTRLMQALAAQAPFLDTFSALLQDEIDRRHSRLMARRFKLSGLDEKPSLADFDWRFNPKLPRAACFELHTLKFLSEGANALIVGKPGTGKSHIAKAVAYQATLHSHEVAYVEADSEFARYRALREARFSRTDPGRYRASPPDWSFRAAPCASTRPFGALGPLQNPISGLRRRTSAVIAPIPTGRCPSARPAAWRCTPHT